MAKYLSLDLEISAIIPDDASDWKQFRPLGITCYALACVLDDGTIVADAGRGMDSETLYAPRMQQWECAQLVYQLMRQVKKGYTLLTWNGLGFDWDILAEESGMHSECAELALNHVDPMFQMLCIRGFPVGLDAVAKGLGLPGKTEGMSGAKAPEMWAAGQYEQVLGYVQQDVRCTLEVALEIEKHRVLRWISKRGDLKTQFMPMLLPVREALQLPEPNTSWMDSPRSRESFTEWMKP